MYEPARGGGYALLLMQFEGPLTEIEFNSKTQLRNKAFTSQRNTSLSLQLLITRSHNIATLHCIGLRGRVLTSAATVVGGLLFIMQLMGDIPRAWKFSLGGGQTSMCKQSECSC
jgi:hypothetical protein